MSIVFSTVGTPVENTPKRKFGQLLLWQTHRAGEAIDLYRGDFEQHILLQQYKLL